ncbi:ATP-dependent RecD-like DNA helicase [Caldibacillus lycopersici]|uniref:ATP-dependent RecD2 DNA helicase n=1 Tax=Perspicuibacillus lycopersici TaxID=1325689 RepID=A0AAE3ITA4_9BACI|nr:ATP-dependent RecD-like DNA helicase [Perspicuibacillus lycopersici]MCU9613972.1 ATP-dependent RecD-like DNA helicase [Perspicuibacillus lycopersici]
MVESQQAFIKGRHIVTIFHNETNLYTVLRIRVEDCSEDFQEKEAVITGYFPRIHEEESYTFYGEFQEHPRYGKQFQTTHFQQELPQTKQGVIQYLSSDLFKGIGKKTAESIVEVLGENAISRILASPSLLDTVPKLSPEKAKELYEALLEHQGLEKILVQLNQYGFGPQLSMRIYQSYKEETLHIIEKNPYRLVEDVEGIGFGRADELGSKLGIQGNHPDRIKAGCLYKLEVESLNEGHSFLLKDHLINEVKKLLESKQPIQIDSNAIAYEILKLEEEKKLVVEENRVYMPSVYYSEKGLVNNIKRILSQKEYKDQFPESEFLLALGSLEERLSIEYAPSQREAIQKALTSPMLILTGGPGTGKTTVIKGIVELYSELHGCSLDPKDYKRDEVFPFLLAAPTGRAAKRMSESTGLPAVTIHRLLGWNGTESFDYHEDNPIEGKIIIIDEMSMVDIWLAHNLFKALPEHMQVIVVGDEDQLPSVGPGQVLKDLLASERIPTVRLTDIYRQENGSSIIDLAHSIKNGKVPSNLLEQQKDRSFIPCSTGQMSEVVKQIVTHAIKKGYSKKDIQVLAPMYRGPAGVDQLNIMLQEILNGNPDGRKRELTFGDIVYRVGDKILQLVNQPEKNIFNGDMGEIVAIFFAKENEEKQDQLIVSFDGNEITYTRQDLNQITLAYCCSIHKSQGSEFPVVLLPIVKSYYRMLRRNLLYTAVTRSKEKLILCGEMDAFQMAVNRTDDNSRNTTLKDRIVESITNMNVNEKNVADEAANTEQFPFEELLMKTDPMIGMSNISPFDFMEG